MRALSRIAAVAVAGAALYLAGIVNSLRNGGLPLLRAFAYSAHKAIAGIIFLVVAWRTRRTSPELVRLFALAALARMPLGKLATERARTVGGLTIFAAPSRS